MSCIEANARKVSLLFASFETIVFAAPSSDIPPELPIPIRDALTIASKYDYLSVVVVKGMSMRPYFNDGAVLVVKKTSFTELTEGELVIYRSRDGRLIVHRIESHEEGGFVIKGSANVETDDERVTDENLVGVVYITIYGTGYASYGDLDSLRIAVAHASETKTQKCLPSYY